MEELKVTFYLKKNEERADGTVPVLGRIRIGKSMVQFSTKVYVIPALWNVKSGRAVGKSKQAAATYKELSRNPAKENQATDRAYRIGQEKDVFVYYPMAVSREFKSFDETLDELLSRKASLATSTIFPTERVEVRQEEIGQMLFGA